jgi:hypothetical protein
MLLALSSWLALAAPREGACVPLDVRSGEPFSVGGTVHGFERSGGLSLLDSRGRDWVIHGLGPPWFWREQGLLRPMLGDSLVIDGRTLDCGSGPEHIATVVTAGGRILELRDRDTGLPRWAPPAR